MWLCLLSFLIVFEGGYGLGRGDLEKYGPFQIALRSLKCDRNRSLDLDVSGITVYFFDFPNNETKAFPINDAARSILSYENFNPINRFIIFVGGFKSNINKKTEKKMIETFRNFPNSYFILFDHSAYTHDRDGAIKSYERSVKYAHYIGKSIAGVLTQLTYGGISAKSFHCIGHSLGSQILGHVGDSFYKSSGQKIWRITGIDPAGPCFSNSLIEEQLRSGVAEYVEVYHCNAGALGTASVLADVDFFVNKKGQIQPNCKMPLIPGIFDSRKAAQCNHRACIDLWTATVKHRDWYKAWKCDSYKNFKADQCSDNDVTIAGFWNPGNATGVFYFTTAGYIDVEDEDLPKL